MMTNNLITRRITSFLFLCLLCSATTINAQESDEATPFDDEWGLNVTAFANQFLSFNGNEAPSGDYLLTYKKIKNNTAFRLGFGLNINHVSGDEGNSIVPFNQTLMSFDLRLGGEKRYNIGKRWLFTGGFDALLGANLIKFESSNNFNSGEQKDNSFLFGMGPVLGIHYRFNDRISIGTESTIYLSYTLREQKTSGGFNGSSETDKGTVINMNLTPPLALYFSIRI